MHPERRFPEISPSSKQMSSRLQKLGETELTYLTSPPKTTKAAELWQDEPCLVFAVRRPGEDSGQRNRR